MKKNVAVVCGGDSGEFEISLKSGKVVKTNLDPEKYNAYLVVIKGAEWRLLRDDSTAVPVDKNDFSVLIQGKKLTFDVVFNAIHGTPGEDGKLPGYLDMLGIPHTGSSHVVAAVTFNKHFCKQVVASRGVSLANAQLIRKGQLYSPETVIASLGLPVFVKPNSNGSSVGVSKVNEINELMPALEKAFAEDNEALVEAFIKGREIGCGVFDYKGRKIVFPLTEIISKKEFFDYEAKYSPGMSDEITPASVDENTEIEIKAMAADLYSHLGCKGIVRFDFILTENDIYFLEVNTIPGLSAASIVPQQAKTMGISLPELFGMVVENALSAHH